MQSSEASASRPLAKLARITYRLSRSSRSGGRLIVGDAKHMKDFLKETVFGPLARRLGTFAGAYLLSFGVNTHDTNTIVAGVICALLVAFDLVSAHMSGRKVGR